MTRRFFYIAVDEAINRMMELGVGAIGSEIISIRGAFGRVLAEEIVCAQNRPPLDSSHFDGYAIRSEDSGRASTCNPILLRVKGCIYPGERMMYEIGPGEAYYVTTGSFLPKGSDAVIAMEATKAVSENLIEVRGRVRKGEHVISAGQDVRKSETLLPKGHILRAQDIALLASLNVGRVKVAKKPIVAIIPVGDELTNNIEPPDPDKIVNTHSLILLDWITKAGGLPIDLGIAPDNPMNIRRRLEKSLREADMVLTIGGISMGKRDFVPDALESIGGKVIVHGIKRRPGRVSGFGMISGKPVVMLPGLIHSLIVGFHLFALPLIRLMLGLSPMDSWPTMKAKMAKAVYFRNFVPFQQVTFVRVNKVQNSIMAEPIPGESALLGVVVRANGFVITPEDRRVIEEGEEVEIYLLPGFSIF